MMTPLASRITIAPDVMFREVGDETVLLDLKSERYLGLDEVGTRMWQLLTQSGSVQSAYDSLRQEFDVSPEQLQQDLDAFVQELLGLGLIQVDGPR